MGKSLDKQIEKFVDTVAKLNIEVLNPNASGRTIVFLHGIAASNSNWQRVYGGLSSNTRIVLVDLLGFGESPVPSRADYSVATHAKAVWLSLDAHGIFGDVLLVGHSMGCIIATKMAYLRPLRIKELYLLSLPIYKGYDIIEGTAGRVDSFVNKMYFKFYQSICESSLLLVFVGSMLTSFFKGKYIFQLKLRNLTAFRRSLVNCIEFQRTEVELMNLPAMPVHLYYGQFDIFVIHKYLNELGRGRNNTTIKRVNSGHSIIGPLAKAITYDLQQLDTEATL